MGGERRKRREEMSGGKVEERVLGERREEIEASQTQIKGSLSSESVRFRINGVQGGLDACGYVHTCLHTTAHARMHTHINTQTLSH